MDINQSLPLWFGFFLCCLVLFYPCLCPPSCVCHTLSLCCCPLAVVMFGFVSCTFVLSSRVCACLPVLFCSVLSLVLSTCTSCPCVIVWCVSPACHSVHPSWCVYLGCSFHSLHVQWGYLVSRVPPVFLVPSQYFGLSLSFWIHGYSAVRLWFHHVLFFGLSSPPLIFPACVDYCLSTANLICKLHLFLQ